MLVQDLMVRDVATISPMAPLREAMKTMKARRVKSLVVERRDAHDVYGIITYTNILKTIVAEEGDIDLINVYDVCAKPALTISAQAQVKYAARMMVNMRLRRLLAMEGNDMVGIITMNDIVGSILQMAEIDPPSV
ncbi:CBS domain-containing protein [Tepidicella baoligensis]|uniref:CBS domain-containing protein n=1 Tax=Tepidicella baoligensis TaxID=2707016 RepID=UPI0015DA4AB8|nr:CBS domain-containing protein [Tepidicella baoligensis]